MTAGAPVSSAETITLPHSSSLKLVATILDGKTAKKPHQAFLILQETDSGLEEAFALTVKDNGKAKLDIV